MCVRVSVHFRSCRDDVTPSSQGADSCDVIGVYEVTPAVGSPPRASSCPEGSDCVKGAPVVPSDTPSSSSDTWHRPGPSVTPSGARSEVVTRKRAVVPSPAETLRTPSTDEPEKTICVYIDLD